MISDDANKLNRIRAVERERKQRIFNDKFRLIGVDKQALENQVKERRQREEQYQMYEEVLEKNLRFFSEQAIHKEQLVKFLAYKESEYQRQIENKLLAHEQKIRKTLANEEAISNVPTDDYYNYFNTSSR